MYAIRSYYAIKTALINEAGEIVGIHVTDSGSLFHKNAKEALRVLLEKSGVDREQLKYP